MAEEPGQPWQFEIGRDNRATTVTVEYVPQCDYSFVLTFSDEINAQADGGRILVTTGMLRFADADDDLAIILAHELAHNMLTYLTRWGEPRTRETRIRDEREADHVGIYLAARAGFDFGRATRFGAVGVPSIPISSATVGLACMPAPRCGSSE